MRTEFEVFVCGLEFSLNLIKNKIARRKLRCAIGLVDCQ